MPCSHPICDPVRPSSITQKIDEVLAHRNGARNALPVHRHGDRKLLLAGSLQLCPFHGHVERALREHALQVKLCCGAPEYVVDGIEIVGQSGADGLADCRRPLLPLIAAIACTANVGLTSLPK